MSTEEEAWRCWSSKADPDPLRPTTRSLPRPLRTLPPHLLRYRHRRLYGSLMVRLFRWHMFPLKV
jgi:hypothetical protein